MESILNSIKEFFASESFTSLLQDWGVKIITALAIFIIGRWITKAINRWLRKLLTAKEMDPTLTNFLCNFVYAILLTAVIVSALQVLGVPITGLAAILGAAGLAIGLALKDSLGNFAAGVMLAMFRPFKAGDLVEVAGVTGKVDEIRIFSTILNTNDNVQVTIPNGTVVADPIINHTAHEVRRVDLTIGVGYDDDLKQARDILLSVCQAHPKVLEDPSVNVFVIELADSSVNFVVRPWCKTEDYWSVWGDVLEQSKVALEAAGLSIPYPQQDVHMHTIATES